MSEIISSQSITLPLPSAPMSVRVATRDDMPFMDALQKQHSKALGFFPRAQMKGYIDAGNVLIAEVACSSQPSACSESNTASCKPQAVGYCISKDRYLKRDELGAVFQLCVVAGRQRSFIGANLLREVFERSAYGCKLYCCWCAQDLPANRFWEAMGFVPIAYRCGGRRFTVSGWRQSDSSSPSTVDRRDEATPIAPSTSPRIHIFWQKRIRANDNSTPYWFPAKTEGGAIREDRIILPIPPGMKWTDELPVLVPQPAMAMDNQAERRTRTRITEPRRAEPKQCPSEPKPIAMGAKRSLQVVFSAANRFAAPSSVQDVPTPSKPRPSLTDGEQRKSQTRIDPALIAKARELRDRWMEQLNAETLMPSAGKYNVARLAA